MLHLQHDKLTGSIVGIVVSYIDFVLHAIASLPFDKIRCHFYHMTSLIQTFANVR